MKISDEKLNQKAALELKTQQEPIKSYAPETCNKWMVQNTLLQAQILNEGQFDNGKNQDLISVGN